MYRNEKQKYFFDFSNCDKCINAKHTQQARNKIFYVYRNRKQYNLTPPARISNLTTPGILNDITDRLPT